MTPFEDLRIALSTAQDGETITPTGEVFWLRKGIGPRTFAKPVTIDFGKLVISGEPEWWGAEGIIIKGGVWTSRLLLRSCANVAIAKSAFQRGGLQVIGAKGLSVGFSRFEGCGTSVGLDKVDGFQIADNVIVAGREDGIKFQGSRNGIIARNVIHGMQRGVDGVHPDGIQGLPGGGLQENLTIEDNDITGDCQGTFLPGVRTEGVMSYRNVVARRNRIRVSAQNGLRFDRVDGLLLEDNVVSALPGYGSAIKVNGCVNVTYAGVNLQGGVIKNG